MHKGLQSRFLLYACLLAGWVAYAGPMPPPNQKPNAHTVTNTHFRQTGPGLFELGKVRLDRRQNQVSFPAVVNMQEGMVEYLVVANDGKLHESVLRTDVEPYHIHLGMLLLDAKGAQPGAILDNDALQVPGDAVRIEVSWNKDGKQRRVAAEDLIWDSAARRPLKKGDWVYNGSRLIDGTFIAQRDRSIVAIIRDVDALVNYPRWAREPDENWTVNAKICPPPGTEVQVTITLPGNSGGKTRQEK